MISKAQLFAALFQTCVITQETNSFAASQIANTNKPTTHSSEGVTNLA